MLEELVHHDVSFGVAVPEWVQIPFKTPRSRNHRVCNRGQISMTTMRNLGLPRLLTSARHGRSGGRPHRTGDVVNRLRVKISVQGPVRASLIKKGTVYSTAHGEMDFTVRLFDAFMRRAMPVFPAPQV